MSRYRPRPQPLARPVEPRPPKPPPTCSVYTEGVGVCGAVEGVRQYLNHYGCPEHTPAKLRARYEAAQAGRQGAT